MASIHETGQWPDDIYRIQKNDPILAGQDGIINVQPTQIASRTLWLKTLFEKEHNPDGTHMLTKAGLADGELIPEGRLLLDVPTQILFEMLGLAKGDVERLYFELEAVMGQSGYLFRQLAETLKLNWRYGLWGAEFEFFRDGFTMRDVNNQACHRAIGRDDSIDVRNTSGIRPGMRMLVSDGLHRQEVEILLVLDDGRIRLVSDLEWTFGPRTILGYTDWDISKEGVAFAKKGSQYYSRVFRTFEDAGIGSVYVCVKQGSAPLLLEYRSADLDGPWESIEPKERIPDRDDSGREYIRYQIRALETQIRITAAGDSTIYNISAFPDPYGVMPGSIRTPDLLHPDGKRRVYSDCALLDSSDFYTAYKDYFVQTEYGFFDPDSGELAGSAHNRCREYYLNKTGIASGVYDLRCRHQADTGEWSLWSPPVRVEVKGQRKLFGFLRGFGARGLSVGEWDLLCWYPREFGFEGVKYAGGFDEFTFCEGVEDSN